jgi:primosomal protein N' (replication factor Y)
MQAARVAVDVPVDKTFDYAVPPEWEGALEIGHLVMVGFRTGVQPGIVVELIDAPHEPRRLKPILDLLDSAPVVTPAQIAIARWIAEAYLTPIGSALWLWLPPGLTGRRDIEVALLDAEAAGRDGAENAVIDLLKRRGTLRGGQIQAALPGVSWRAAVDALAKAGVVSKTPTLAPARARPRSVQTAALAVHPSEIAARAAALGRPSRAADLLECILSGIDHAPSALKAARAEQRHLDKLIADGVVRAQQERIRIADGVDPSAAIDALRKLDKPKRILRLLEREAGAAVDVSWIYAQTGAALADLKRLEAAGLIVLGARQSWRGALAAHAHPATDAPPLTPAQEAVWEQVRAALERGSSKPFLLHGVTGSGKTEIYLRAIERALALGKQAILLVPEIALTPQTVARAAARFPGQTLVVHSGLSDGERCDAWTRARSGAASVVVGARSALFTPFPNVGLIVLDEEHDSSYKQSPAFRPPHYHARAVAERMAAQFGALLLLGSATPDVETHYRAERGAIIRLALPDRVSADGGGAPPMPSVQIVDMRLELKRGNTSMFSRALQTGIEAALARREQVILFLNRRGQSTYVFCRDCGFVAACPNCDTPLTYHRASHHPQGGVMRCHRCGHYGDPPAVCPKCGSKRIRYFGAGTQQVEEALRAAFPHARALRWDADSAAHASAHAQIMQKFIDHEADVLIGTQMIAKGLDLPRVTLVGVISADLGLALPDFRANERAFQLLTQVVGRSGRGRRGGSAILQTYQPEHYAIVTAAAHDYAAFYAREIAYRREMGYPPFRRMARLLFQFDSAAKAQSEAERAAALLRQRLIALNMTGTALIGPAPCFYMKENNIYRWHLLLRGPDPAAALHGLDMPKGWTVDIDPVDLL